MVPDFQPYLESIRATYAKWWQLYTLTDAAGKQRSAKEVAPTFDFGLMVQTVKREERGEQREEEKVERFPVLEGIRKYADQHVLLVGRPGSGKSTALARLMLEEATTPQARIPVLVELRYWQGSIEQLIRDSFTRHDLPAELVDEALKRSLILFDGVNELPSEEARSQLSAFRRNHPKLPMIFTTRDLTLGGDLGIEQQLEMQPLTEAQMQAFIRAYVPERAEAMLRQLKDRLRELGQTPLLLWMLCRLLQQTGTIPENLGLVFREFTHGYERYLKENVRVESNRSWWKPVLQHLAWVMTQGETLTEVRVAISREEAVRVITQFCNGREDLAQVCLLDLQKHHLIQASVSTEELEFRHQLIQEYYAAETLLEQLPKLSNEQLKQKYLNYLKWTEPVALMLTLEKNEAQALRVIELALEVDLRLGARLTGEVRQEFQAQAIEILNKLQVHHPWKLGWIKVKRKINLPAWLKIRLLEETKSKTAIAILIKQLKHSDSSVRKMTARALGNVRSEIVVPALIERLEDSNSSVCEVAAQALCDIGAEAAAVPILLKCLEDPGSDSYTRMSAARVLGNIGSEAAIPILLKWLEDPDFTPYMRVSAVRALGQIRSETAISALLKRLEDSDSSVSWNVAQILGKVGSETAISALLKGLENSDSYVRWNAAQALGQIGSETVISALLKRLEDSDSNVRWSAAQALGQIGSETAIPALLKRLEDSNSYVRRNAAQALGQIGSETAIPALLKRLEDSKSLVRCLTTLALGNIGSETAIPALLERLEDSDSSVRWGAAQALNKIGPETVAVPILLKQLEYLDSVFYKSLASLLRYFSFPLLMLSEDHYSLACKRVIEVLDSIAKKYASMIAPHLPHLHSLLLTRRSEYIYEAILTIQKNCKYYNYDIHQQFYHFLFYDMEGKTETFIDCDRSPTTINNFPNATEVKIFEQVDRYHEAPPKDPPS